MCVSAEETLQVVRFFVSCVFALLFKKYRVGHPVIQIVVSKEILECVLIIELLLFQTFFVNEMIYEFLSGDIKNVLPIVICTFYKFI